MLKSNKAHYGSLRTFLGYSDVIMRLFRVFAVLCALIEFNLNTNVKPAEDRYG